jgi:hypothetical protein
VCLGCTVLLARADLYRPWIYHISAILLACVAVMFLFSQESRPSVIMKQKIIAIQKRTGFHDLDYDSTDKIPSLGFFARTMLVRPTHFFFTEPIICLVSTMSATVFSSIYLQTEGLTVPFEKFGYSERQISLVYYAWIVGIMLTIPLRMMDWHIVSQKMRRHKVILPESKLTGFYVAAPVLAIALWWFAWTIPPRVSALPCQTRIPYREQITSGLIVSD